MPGKPPALVVIGASAGGVETLRRVVAGLPVDLRATVCVVLHIAPSSPSALARILERAGKLPCRSAADGDPLRPGEILVAPPDRHLVIADGVVHLTVGPRENGHRPAIDALFRSAAEAFYGQVIGVVLSGTRDDGSAGLAVVKAKGGLAIVQDPKEAMYAGMPRSAIDNVAVDAVVPSSQVAATVVAMVNGDRHERAAPDPNPEEARDEPASAVPSGNPTIGDPPPEDPDDPEDDPEPTPGRERESSPEASVTTTCPECGGVLSERRVAGMTQWGCRVGHRYSPESLLDAQAAEVEAALWAAVRALEDRRILLEGMAERFERTGQLRSARSFRRRATEAGNQARACETRSRAPRPHR